MQKYVIKLNCLLISMLISPALGSTAVVNDMEIFQAALNNKADSVAQLARQYSFDNKNSETKENRVGIEKNRIDIFDYFLPAENVKDLPAGLAILDADSHRSWIENVPQNMALADLIIKSKTGVGSKVVYRKYKHPFYPKSIHPD